LRTCFPDSYGQKVWSHPSDEPDLIGKDPPIGRLPSDSRRSSCAAHAQEAALTVPAGVSSFPHTTTLGGSRFR
jgi:hypothetical protein